VRTASAAERANRITYFLKGDLAKHPKGFIPELTDANGLMWIEERLRDEHLGPQTRAGRFANLLGARVSAAG
jgi:hypothetical protein